MRISVTAARAQGSFVVSHSQGLRAVFPLRLKTSHDGSRGVGGVLAAPCLQPVTLGCGAAEGWTVAADSSTGDGDLQVEPGPRACSWEPQAVGALVGGCRVRAQPSSLCVSFAFGASVHLFLSKWLERYCGDAHVVSVP